MAQGIGACVLVNLESRQRILTFIPFLVFNGLYAWWRCAAPRRPDWFEDDAMGLERATATIVLGFREEAWPKGHGSLFWQMDPGGREVLLRACDVYEIGDDAVSRIFEEALVVVLLQLGIGPSDVAGLSITSANG